MTIAAHLSRSGDLFFRYRSWGPILLFPLLVGPLAWAHYPFGSHALDIAWEVACFIVALGGFALRVVTVASSPRGTSGRNTRAQKASVLNTTGAYSIVRHPLYLGNYLVALGVSCFPRTWYLPLIVSLGALLYYERIALREEEYLEKKFGHAFLSWAARTPAIIPTFQDYHPAATPHSWKKALRGEYDGVLKITAPFLVLDVLQEFAITGRLTLDPLWTALFTVGAVLFVVLRTMKKRGLLADRGVGETRRRNETVVK